MHYITGDATIPVCLVMAKFEMQPLCKLKHWVKPPTHLPKGNTMKQVNVMCTIYTVLAFCITQG